MGERNRSFTFDVSQKNLPKMPEKRGVLVESMVRQLHVEPY
jgi:hypothetical protein